MAHIQVIHKGQLGNRIFQYAFCAILQKLVPGARLTGYHLPELGVVEPRVKLPGRILAVSAGHHCDVAALRYALRSGIYDSLRLQVYAQRLEYYDEHRAFIASLLPSSHDLPDELLGDDHIVINVRAGDIIAAPHRDYLPLPASFIVQIVRRSGLKPVLMGQIDDGAYCQAIRHHLPDAQVIPHCSVQGDFSIIRKARHVIIPVSTFSWMAAWLSDAATTIHMPICGLYNPLQRPDIDLVPLTDTRYRFYDFPVEHWRGQPGQFDALTRPEGDFPELSRQDIAHRITVRA